MALVGTAVSVVSQDILATQENRVIVEFLGLVDIAVTQASAALADSQVFRASQVSVVLAGLVGSAATQGIQELAGLVVSVDLAAFLVSQDIQGTQV